MKNRYGNRKLWDPNEDRCVCCLHALEEESTKLIPNPTFRSSHLELFYKKGVLKNFAKFTGKNLCQSLFFNKVAGLGKGTLLKRSFSIGVFL